MNEREVLYRGFRRAELEASRERVKNTRNGEVKSAMRGTSAWRIYDSDLTSFSDTFEPVLPLGQDLKTYIETTFASQKGEILGLELGGPGVELFKGFSPDLFKKSAGVCLFDERVSEGNHTIITGDLLSLETKQDVQKWSGEEKVHVIIQRMYAGHESLPLDPFFLAQKSRSCYRLLADGGILLAEVPWAFNLGILNYMPEWVAMLEQDYSGQLDVKAKEGYLNLRKLPGAPEELPLLPSEQILEREMNRQIARGLPRRV